MLVNENDLDYDHVNHLVLYKNEPFTGKSVEFTNRGNKILSEYIDGVREGKTLEFFLDGTLKKEENYKNNILHGLTKIFLNTNQISYLIEYEFDFKVKEERFDGTGQRTYQFTIDEKSNAFNSTLRL